MTRKKREIVTYFDLFYKRRSAQNKRAGVPNPALEIRNRPRNWPGATTTQLG